MKRNKNQRQHGDVTLTKISALPNGAKEVKSTGNILVLAEGESTGHRHVLTLERPVDGKLWIDGKSTLVTIEKPTPLSHEEHQTQILDPGTYRVGRINEFDWTSKMVRKVQD